VAVWMQMAVLSSKIQNAWPCYRFCQTNARPICEFFHSPAGSVPWQEEAIGDVQ
jgi:hypothetical protein